jgi:predicted aminopeptidase
MRRPLLVLCCCLVGGCATLGYYGQAVWGQLGVLAARRPIDRVLADPDTPAETARKLEVARAARGFAQAELALPRTGSYRSYVALDRPYPVWSVIAAPELSVEPRVTCYLLVGCLAYRGYFDRAAAEREAARLARQGYDVDIGPVPAYSTLGWFDDPVFSSMLAWDDATLAEMIFHEHAHELVYTHDDTAFDEAFATLVGQEGVRRWLATRGDAAARERWAHRREIEREFVALLLAARADLAALYAGEADEAAKRAGKRARLERLRDEARTLGARLGDTDMFAAWFARPVNNARLALVATYEDRVPAFEALLAQEGGELPRFYARVRALARMDADARAAALAAYAQGRP